MWYVLVASNQRPLLSRRISLTNKKDTERVAQILLYDSSNSTFFAAKKTHVSYTCSSRGYIQVKDAWCLPRQALDLSKKHRPGL